jgi:putative phage-type endonuclease
VEIINLDQRSDGWHKWRAAGIGSSDAAKIVNLSPYGKAKDVWLDKCLIRKGKPPIKKMDNSAMARGRRLEPKIVQYVEQLAGCSLPAVCGIREDRPHMRASLDGYNVARKLVIEAKAVKREYHELALAGGIPAVYWPQVHHQLLVSAAPELWYCSFSDYFPDGQQLAVVKVWAEKEAANLKLLLDIEDEFWQWVESGDWPWNS